MIKKVIRLINQQYNKYFTVPKREIVEDGVLKDLQLYINVNRDQAFVDMKKGVYDDFILNTVQKQIKSGQTIWDIGAYIGHDTLGFAVLVGSKGKVIAFDANPYNLERLAQNIIHNKEVGKRIMVVKKALGDKVGKAVFNVSSDVDSTESSGSYLGSVLPPLLPSSYKRFQGVKVNVTTIDELVFFKKLAVPDLIHLDVEGAEGDVVRGGLKVIKKYHPKFIMEVHNLRAMLQLSQLLIPLGYQIKELSTSESSPSRGFIYAQYFAR